MNQEEAIEAATRPRAEHATARATLLAYQEAEKSEPDAWIVETRGGNVIYWTSKERSIAEQVAASYNREAIPLYRHPPCPVPADVVALRRLAERCYQLDHQPEEHTLGGKCLACEAEDALALARGK